MKFKELLLTATFFITACQTMPYQGQARDIKKKPQEEGIIGIPLNFRDEDRAVADMRMRNNCQPGNFKVLEEGEVVVGQETKSSARETDRKSTEHKAGSLFGIPVTSGEAGGKDSQTTQVTTNVKEWQISYKCLASAAETKKTKVR